MPYIIKDQDDNIITMCLCKQFISTVIDVTTASRSYSVVTITLESPVTYSGADIKLTKISGATNNAYNGEFAFKKTSDTEFTYNLKYPTGDQPTGDIKAVFYLPDESYEYVEDDDAAVIALNTKLSNINQIRLKKQSLVSTDYKVLRHNEEICCGVIEANRTLTQVEFDALHTERNQLRDEINILEATI